MNEHIKVLFEQSGGYMLDETCPELGDLDLNKFVELLIQECANFTDPVTRNLMLQHFGVE